MARWQVDPGVRDMIDYLDDPRRRGRWDVLNAKELAAIEREIKRCRESFEYAARNYFWITDKNRRDVNFSLWEAQELILEKLYELKRRGKAQKLMVLKARQLGCCLAPSTPVLRADLSWAELDEIEPGELVAGYDAEGMLRPTLVVAKRYVQDWAFALSMDNGKTLVATPDHRFLALSRDGSRAGWFHVWELERGCSIRFIADLAGSIPAPADEPGACWVRLADLRPLPRQTMIDLQTTTETFIAEGFVSHNSTLIEALIAHRVLFFRNIEALVVSVDRAHSAYLFSIILHILDRLPWWLQPMVAARKYEEGLWLANPDPALRRDYPGLNSRVVVQASNQISGIGQGRRLNACHISEGADWDQRIHRATMEGDLQYALADSVETFAVWESTAKGAGTYTERLWLTNVKLGEKAEWEPLFLPWFFERTRVLAPEPGWRPEPPELAMRERIMDDWVVCERKECRKIVQNHPVKGVTRLGQNCPACGEGKLVPYVLSDEQLCWMWKQRINKEMKGEDAVKELRAELCSTPQEAFQIHGLQVFGPECQEWVNSTIRAPKLVGDFDDRGQFHAKMADTGRCFQNWCELDHSWDEKPLEIWKLPEPNAQYVIGVDVAEGLGGKADYSVAFVNKVGSYGEPDEQVAMYRTNTVDAIRFAYIVTWLGHWYNRAMLAIEYNGIGAACADTVRLRLLYPNLFRWLRPDNERPETHSWHWVTNYRTKPKLWQTARRFLRARAWIIRSEQFYEEMLRFQKEDYSDISASAESGWYDDTIMAGMIALYASHVLDTDEQAIRPSPTESVHAGEQDPYAWKMTCRRCNHQWYERDPDVRCPKCGTLMVSGTPPGGAGHQIKADLERMEEEYERIHSGQYDHEEQLIHW